MAEVQRQLFEQKKKDKEEQEAQKKRDAEHKQREQAEQKVRDEQNKERTVILANLEMERKQRAIEILNILSIKGFKKINKEKIKDLEKAGDGVDYDAIIEFY